MPTPPRYAVGFIGGGNMATALLRGLVGAGLYEPAQLVVSDIDPARRRALARRLKIGTTADNRDLAARSRVILLAVKPQQIDAILTELADVVTRRQVVISILAGVPTRRLEKGLGDGVRVVRVMPNTPSLLGQGMAVAVRGRAATQADERLTLKLLRAVGKARAVDDERLLDAVTGLSGSGPAFVYRFAEALVAGGRKAGLATDLAEELALQTIRGAAAMLQEAGEPPETLRQRVTSPGGTTEAGLAALHRREFYDAVVEAVVIAAKRSRELGRG